ncbi:MAG: DUF4272 domain-containing protein [Methyloversatilis discipulorum]|jgi:hypothetical protein|uniref:DUF4272 domain-containing protein n=1 Tax=Methyloversatilis discipulorum TaxID=1119528 RepID=UPI0026EBF8F9|nr:DUF4272 domain-containing protein [Methyloversatilis discipulorum]MBT9517551.1 DUF4272 domain-containing protein [Methyloversatilis discipulorum]
MESEEILPEDEVREASEIARRALALFAVVGLALGAPKETTLTWLRGESLWDELSPEELKFVSALEPTERQRINASWRSEALLMLLWSIGVVKELPGLAEQCDAGNFQRVLPPFADVTVNEFISSAQRRSDDELFEMANELLDSHWEARDARINKKPMPANLDIGIIQERHHAINWVIGYDGLPWDEVTTDT